MKLLSNAQIPAGGSPLEVLDNIARLRLELEAAEKEFSDAKQRNEKESKAKEDSGIMDVLFDIWKGITNIFELLKVAFYFKMAYKFFNEIDGDRRQTGAVKSLIGKVEGVLAKHHFSSLEDTIVPCPDGFRGDFPAYVEVLKKQYTECSQLTLETLKLLITHTKSFNSDRIFRRQKLTLPPPYVGLRKKIDLWTKESTAFIDGTNQRQRLGVMFSDKSVIVPAMHNAVQTQEKTFDQDPSFFRKESDKALVLLDESSKMYNGLDKADQRESQHCALTIAEMAMLCAHCTEYLASLYMRIETASVTSGNISQALLRLNQK